ncbi:MAG: hypothetical protein AAF085_13930 [Planctomycetota bacterium]
MTRLVHSGCRRVSRQAQVFATLIAVTWCSSAAAQLELVYSFEDGTQGFVPNGGLFPVEVDTIGATDGVQSLEVAVPEPATFVGALTDQVDAFVTVDPLESVVFDLTITEMFPEEAAFVDAGITFFGSSQPDFPGGPFEGLQVQFQADQVQLQDLQVGTHEIRIDLLSATNPLTFESGLPFNEIFGDFGSGPNDLIATGFQIYINKSADAPWTGYFDNIRVGVGPDGLPGDANGDGSVDLLDLDILGANFGLTPADLAEGDFNDDDIVDLLDLDILGANFGTMAAASTSVPEPSATMLVAAWLAAFAARLRAAR